MWHTLSIQNDLIHGWGLDFALRMCVEVCHVLHTAKTISSLTDRTCISYIDLTNYLLNAARPWKNRSSWFSVDRPSNCPFIRESSMYQNIDLQLQLHNGSWSKCTEYPDLEMLRYWKFSHNISKRALVFLQGQASDGHAPWEGVCITIPFSLSIQHQSMHIVPVRRTVL